MLEEKLVEVGARFGGQVKLWTSAAAFVQTLADHTGSLRVSLYLF